VKINDNDNDSCTRNKSHNFLYGTWKLYIYNYEVKFGNDDLDALRHTGLPSHLMLLRAVGED